MLSGPRGLMGRVLRTLHADPYGDLLAARTSERLRKLLSPHYLLDKLALLAHERLHPDEPWLTRDAVRLLEGYLSPAHAGFEWGSGNGSAWFARRCGSLVSVEHHRGWSQQVQARLRAEGLHHVDHRFVEEAHYTSVIDTFADAHFDFILVDGLFRDEAFLRSLPKLKPGGWLIFDNANWYLPSASRTPHSRSLEDGPASPGFAEVARRIQGWPLTWTSNGVNDTAIYVKPAALQLERAG